MLALLLSLQIASQHPAELTYDARQGRAEVAIPRLDAVMTVDGILDEPVWRRAALLTGFSQYRPVDGRPAADSTHVFVWYSPEAIHFGIRAFEPHGPLVRATLSDRDNIAQDDQIQILLDTFDDRRRAFHFAVNPLGVQEDGVRSEGQAGAAGGPGAGGRFDGVIDLNPDFVFQSRGRITEWGYEVEVRIPFQSIRFQARDPQDWGFQVVRVTQHNGFETTWTPTFRASASFLAQSGRLTGLTGISRGRVLDVTPEVTARVDGAPRAEGGYGYSGDPAVGATLSFGITSNLTLSATANPDFSQVEADVGQVTVNERFALFFPEKRPFFLEGLEQFDTPNRLIYTRRIASPLAGAKLTGKLGGTTVAVLSAVDDRDFSREDAHPVYNLVRLRHDVGEGSTVGLAYTDRLDGGHANRVAALDTRVIWRSIWFSEAQIARSWSRTPQGNVTGTLWQLTLFDRTGRHYGNHAELNGATDAFEAGSGFVPRTGVVNGALFNRLTTYGGSGALLEQASVFLGLMPTWDYDGFFDGKAPIEGTYSIFLSLTLRGGWNVGGAVRNAHQSFDPDFYAGYGVVMGSDTVPFVLPDGLRHMWSAEVNASSPNRPLTANAALGVGAAPIFAEPARGRAVSANLSLRWTPTPRARIEARWAHQRINRARDGSRFATANIPRIKLEYQLSRAVFIRYVGQYLAQERSRLRDPATEQDLVYDEATEFQMGPAAGLVTNEFRNDLLFAYQPSPGTVIFAGYGATLVEDHAFRLDELTRRDDGVFIKVSYLLRI